MSNAIFPALAGLEYPVVRTPIFRTLIQQSTSGKETRAALWTYPRWKWTLSFNFLRDDSNNEFRTLLGFFLARQGAFDSFLFDDADDRQVTGQPIGQGAGSQTAFQLVRSLGGFTEPVFAPHIVSSVYVNGIALPPGGWTVNAGAGMLTLFSPPASGAEVTADFTYYWPVRFLADDNDFSKFMNRLWEQKKLEFESLK
jgi:uncharacterized protein (TIGR02217 family)